MLDDLPLHPGIGHLPIGLAAALPLASLLAGLLVWRESLPRRAWTVNVLLLALALAGGLAAQRTGEQDEDRVEAVVGEALLHEHEERAEAFTWCAGVVLVLAALVLVVPVGRAGRALIAASVLGTMILAGLASWTGHAGGTIVHGPAGLVAGSGAALAPPGELPPAPAGHEAGEDDDD